MRTYLIHRTIPGAGQMDAESLAVISDASNQALAPLSPEVQWVHSYVVDDAIVCVYRAEDPEGIRAHARRGGFPVDTIDIVRAVIDPTTAELAS
jgi:hypothetical protein